MSRPTSERPRTWDGKPSPYWQHTAPIRCPKHHEMGWLGSVYWICSTCHTIYVEQHPPPRLEA